MEAVQIILNNYIKWCLGLDRCTPGYIILEETRVDRLRIKAGERTLKYEQKIR